MPARERQRSRRQGSWAGPAFGLREAPREFMEVAGADQGALGGVIGRRQRPVTAGGVAAPDPPPRVLVPEPVKPAVPASRLPAEAHPWSPPITATITTGHCCGSATRAIPFGRAAAKPRSGHPRRSPAHRAGLRPAAWRGAAGSPPLSQHSQRSAGPGRYSRHRPAAAAGPADSPAVPRLPVRERAWDFLLLLRRGPLTPQRFEDPADRGCADAVAELDQLALDPLVPPRSVLGSQQTSGTPQPRLARRWS
jgi:hypothetical protein